MPGKKDKDERIPVKLPPQLYERVRALVEHAHQFGWASFGAARKDPPSAIAIIDEAVATMERAAKQSKRGRS